MKMKPAYLDLPLGALDEKILQAEAIHGRGGEKGVLSAIESLKGLRFKPLLSEGDPCIHCC
jgi:hypothetical protein